MDVSTRFTVNITASSINRARGVPPCDAAPPTDSCTLIRLITLTTYVKSLRLPAFRWSAYISRQVKAHSSPVDDCAADVPRQPSNVTNSRAARAATSRHCRSGIIGRQDPPRGLNNERSAAQEMLARAPRNECCAGVQRCREIRLCRPLAARSSEYCVT